MSAPSNELDACSASEVPPLDEFEVVELIPVGVVGVELDDAAADVSDNVVVDFGEETFI